MNTLKFTAAALFAVASAAAISAYAADETTPQPPTYASALVPAQA
ncbi:hypothetical protein [Rhodoferax sp.]